MRSLICLLLNTSQENNLWVPLQNEHIFWLLVVKLEDRPLNGREGSDFLELARCSSQTHHPRKWDHSRCLIVRPQRRQSP